MAELGVESIGLDSLRNAHRLAYFLHGDRVLALRITTTALTKVETMVKKQERRQSYRARKHRNKVSMGKAQLLQGLIYRESEPHERRQEESASNVISLVEEDLVVRYIKHLVQVTVERNSFYVTLALCRLLYRYSTEETMAIYDFLTQDQACRREDYYYRSRKGLLMRELEARFRPLLRISRGPRGEEAFQCENGPYQRAALVEECLDRFTPWETECVLPEDFHRRWEELPALRFDGGDPDLEHQVELRRMHTILHPACFRRLTRSLGLDPPECRLAVPSFGLGLDRGSCGGGRARPAGG